MIDTQFPTVNLLMIASYMIEFHVNNLTLLSNMQSCVDGVKLWMTHNKLQLNSISNNNNRLFMAPRLMRAQGAYKSNKHAIPTHTPRPHIPQKHKHSSHGFDGNGRKREISRQKKKRWVFSFDLKEESDVTCLTEKERELQMTGPIY